MLTLLLVLVAVLLLPLAHASAVSTTVVQLSNPMPLFNTTDQPMLVHDGDVRQWVPGGPFFYYGMHYDRCHYIACGDKTCGHLKDHKVLIWKSLSLTNRSWTLVGTALGPSPTLGTFYRPHVNYNPTTKRFVLIVNGNGEGKYNNFASTSESPVGPFTKPVHMSLLTMDTAYNMGDFGFFAEGNDAYLAYNVMGGGQGIYIERLNAAWTNGMNDTTQRSNCLNCMPPLGNGSKWRQYEESPSMFKTAKGKYVVLLAGATCFGVPQPNGGRWGGTGIFAYTANSPIGPYEYYGDINNVEGGLNGQGCSLCMGNACPHGKCVLPVQLNSIVRDHTGAPLALTGGMWGLNAANQTTDILGDYAEYWQPWDHVVDATSGLPKSLQYLKQFNLTISTSTPGLSSSGGSSID